MISDLSLLWLCACFVNFIYFAYSLVVRFTFSKMRELIENGYAQKDWVSPNNIFRPMPSPAPMQEFCRYSLRINSYSLAQKMNEMITRGIKFYTLEFFPQQHAPVQIKEILQSSECTCKLPLFCAVTWHVAAPLTLSPPDIPALQLGMAVAKYSPVMLHLAAVGLTEADVRRVLRYALLQGITSVFLLRGDESEEHNQGSFLHAIDLVKFVRQEFGNLFTVFVAGYPDGHPQAVSYQQDLQHLKDKVDAGADGIISQVVFEAQKFATFVHECRHIGISVPILPGVMPIISYRSLERASHICKFNIPCEVMDALRPIADDNEAVQEYGLRYITKLVQELCAMSIVHGVHFFTMNRPQLVTAIWQQLDLEKEHCASTFVAPSFQESLFTVNQEQAKDLSKS